MNTKSKHYSIDWVCDGYAKQNSRLAKLKAWLKKRAHRETRHSNKRETLEQVDV